jgi:hypothetical protein
LIHFLTGDTMATGNVNAGQTGSGWIRSFVPGNFAQTGQGSLAGTAGGQPQGSSYERAIGPVANRTGVAANAILTGRKAPQGPQRIQTSPVVGSSVFETLARWRRSVIGGVVGAVGMPLSAAVFAAEPAIPQFHPDQAVYCVPDCPFDTTKLEHTLDATDFPVYVIYYSRMDGRGDSVQWTNDRTDDIMDAWAKQGFDQSDSAVIGRLYDQGQRDAEGGYQRGLTTNPPSNITTRQAWEQKDYELQDQHFVPKWSVSDYGGALGDYAAALDREFVRMTGLETERSALGEQIEKAGELKNNSAVTPEEKAALDKALTHSRAVLENKTKTGRPEFSVETLKKETETLAGVVGAIQKNVAVKQQDAIDLSAEIAKVEKAWASTEILPGDKTPANEKAVEKARKILIAKDYAAMKAATKELERLSSPIVKDIADRETARDNLKAAVTRAGSARMSSDLGERDDLGVITAALEQAKSLEGSRDYKAMIQVTSNLNDAAERLEKAATAHREHRIAVGQAREHIEAATDAVEQSLKDDARYLENDDTSSFFSAVAEAKKAAAGDHLELMREKSAALDAKRAELAQLVESREDEATARAVFTGAVALALAGSSIVGIAAFVKRLRVLGNKKKTFREAADGLAKEVENAKVNFVEFQEQRERIKRLKDKEGKTQEFYAEYSRLLNEIVYGIDALEKHVALQRAKAAEMKFWDASPMDGAIKALTEKFEFDTGQVTEADLFGEPQKETKTYKPEEFREDMRQKFARAKELSAKMADAEIAAAKSARVDLPRTELDAFIAQARASGIPVEWLKDHPLYENDARTWDALDAVREKDPVGYVDGVIEQEQKEKQVAVRFAGVVVIMKSVDEAQKRQAVVRVNFDDIVFDDAEGQDPRALETRMRRERAEFDAILARAFDLDAVEKEAQDVIRLFDEMTVRKQAIAGAIDEAQGKVAGSAAGIESIVSGLETAKARHARLLSEGGHSEGSVATAKIEIDQIEEDVAKANAAQAEAERALAEKKFLTAIAKSEAVKTHCQNAAEDLADFDREASARERIKTEFDRYLSSMEGMRRQKSDKMKSYDDVHEDEALFSKGDAFLTALRAEYAGQPGGRDWAVENDRLRDVVAAWDRAVEIVDNRQDVSNMSQQVDELDGRLATAISQAGAIRGFHTDNNLARLDAEIREARADIERAKEARRQAQETLANDDRAAEKAALRAIDMQRLALGNISDITRVASELEAKRREYEREMETLQREKDAAMRELRSYHYASGYDFGRADALFGNLPRSASAYDWFVVQAQVQAIREARRTILASAMAAHRAEENRREARRREEARRAAEARAAEERAAEARRAAQRAAEESRRRSSYSSSSHGGGGSTRHGGHGRRI